MNTYNYEQYETAEQEVFRRANAFRVAISHHRLCVQDLAQRLLKERGDAFSHLCHLDGMVEEFLELHDSSKLSPQFFWSLLKYFGADIQKLSSQEKRKAQLLISEINERDGEVARMFFIEKNLIDENGNPNATAQSLLKLERICDVVERGLSPFSARELGKKIVKGSEFLSDPVEVEIAQWLEKKWAQDETQFNREIDKDFAGKSFDRKLIGEQTFVAPSAVFSDRNSRVAAYC